MGCRGADLDGVLDAGPGAAHRTGYALKESVNWAHPLLKTGLRPHKASRSYYLFLQD